MDVYACMEEWAVDMKVRELTQRTIDFNCQMLRYYLDYSGVKTINGITAASIKSFMLHKKEAGCKAQYINNILKAIKVFCNWLIEEEYLRVSPAAKVKNMKTPKRRIDTFSKKEIYDLVNYYSKPSYNELKWKVILMMLFETGMRINELITLKEEQIKEDYIVIYGKGDKERVVPKTPVMDKWLRKYDKAKSSYFKYRFPQEYYFLSKTGKQLNNQAVSHAMKTAAKAVGIDDSVRVSPHTCRHTFAHQQLMNGLDLYSLMRLMGHTNISITQRYLEGIKDNQVIKRAMSTSVLGHI